jgi:hypothetical protein
MNLEMTVLNRLVAARYLIDTSGQELTPSSDPLVLSQKILLAHDAAELVFIALKAQFQLKSPESNGQEKKESSFIAMSIAVLRYAAETGPADQQKYAKVFEDLNQLRVAFKHHGLLADAATNFHVVTDALRILDELCVQLIERPLSHIDHSVAISSEETMDWLNAAKESIAKEDFKSALESIGQALATASFELNLPIDPGDPSPEVALLLSGRGVDPASFMTMQQLLPRAYYGGYTEWNLRKHGHAANWTRENADYCLVNSISIIIRLQATPTRPLPLDFYAVFEDVVELLVDESEVYWVESQFGSGNEQQVADFRLGDKITGRISGHIERILDLKSELKVDLEFAEWIAVEDPITDRLTFSERSVFGPSNVVWFRSKQVSISYQPR